MTLVLDPIEEEIEEIPVLDPVRERLIRARALIADPEHWCQGHLTQALEEGGFAYCMVGAVQALGRAVSDLLSGEEEYWLVHECFRRLEKVIGLGASLTHYNDCHTHAEVLAAFDRAIAEEA